MNILIALCISCIAVVVLGIVSPNVQLGDLISYNPIAQAATFNYSDYNYTNIYTNKTAADLFESMKGYVIPDRELDFGISISKTCYNIHRFAPVNSSTNCPTYEAIMAIFPDSSNQEVSGKFIYKHGQLQRGIPQMISHYDWYAFQENTTIIFIDPDTETKRQLNMITIQSFLPDYPKSFTVRDNTLVMGHGRFVEECRNATIDGKNWIFLIGDTINYIQNKCSSAFTVFDDTKFIKKDYMEHDITTSAKWLHEEFLQHVKENCLYEYDKC